eukprot:TRINITY_DN5246_c0_g1_i1.p1 TRINITY_DN5246_c0_g1~~TRINITY_DN5246_c0_g1_i1.p1  ORF type:complete len:454 (-),score=17.28 TRINITY_DN5246_c0_g1_i1:2-1363(-)
MIRRPPRSTLSSSSAASDVYKRQMFALPPHHGIRILDGAVTTTTTTTSTATTTAAAPDMDVLEELVHERLDELCSWSEHVHSHRVKTTQVDSSAATNSALRRVAADDLHTCDDDELPLAASAAAPFDQVSTPSTTNAADSGLPPPPPTSTTADVSSSNHHHSHGAPFVHLSPYLTVYTLPFYAYHNHVVNNESATARVQVTEDREAAIAKVSAELEDAAAMESAALKNELFSRQLLMAHVECVKDSNVTNTAVIVTRPSGAVLGVAVKDLPKGSALLQCPDATLSTLSSTDQSTAATAIAAATEKAHANVSSIPATVGLPNVPVEAEAALEAFLGGLYAPLNLASLQEMGFTHILNFAPVSPAESRCISGHFNYLDMYSCFNGSNPSPSPNRHRRDSHSAAHSPLSSATPTSDRSVSQPADEDDSTANDDNEWDGCSDKDSKNSFEIQKTTII